MHWLKLALNPFRAATFSLAFPLGLIFLAIFIIGLKDIIDGWSKGQPRAARGKRLKLNPRQTADEIDSWLRERSRLNPADKKGDDPS